MKTLEEMVDDKIDGYTRDILTMIKDVAGYRFDSDDDDWYSEKIENLLKEFYEFAASVEG